MICAMGRPDRVPSKAICDTGSSGQIRSVAGKAQNPKPNILNENGRE